MKQYIFVGLLMVCVGCGGEWLTSGPSPLETFDQNRLYVLIQAAVSRVRAVECVRYFQEADNQASDNPNAGFMRAALSQLCPANMVKIASYLEHNGVAGVKPAHVKDMAFWERMQAKREEASGPVNQKIREVREAATKCKQAVWDRKSKARQGVRPLRRKDFPEARTYGVAKAAARQLKNEERRKYYAEEELCGSGIWSPPSREDLGISLPEGMTVDMVGRIN